MPAVAAPVPLTEQIRCVQRELGLRRVVYPRRVASGKLAATEAARETQAMQAVLDTLRGLAGTPTATLCWPPSLMSAAART